MLRNDKTTQKLKIGQKRQKLLKPIENNLERVFMTKKQNKFFFETFFIPICTKRLKPLKILLQNEQFSKTATKLKVGEGR